jgi:hypothetical protein
VDVGGVENLQAVVDTFFAEVKVVVFNFKGFLQVAESRPQFLGAPENAGKVVIGDGSVLVSVISQSLGFTEQFKRNVEVFYKG